MAESERTALLELVTNGQWEFVQGGWVSPDEATSTFSAVADQLTQGHQWLHRTFGVTPTIGFQIDPFGASATVAQLYKSAGFTHHIIDRINFRTKDVLKKNKALQFLWYPTSTDSTAPGSPIVAPNFGLPVSSAALLQDPTLSPPSVHYNHQNKKVSSKVSNPKTRSKHATLESSSYIFTHVLDNNYCFPMLDGFDFEGDETTNPKITNANVMARADLYAQHIRKRAQDFRTPHLLMLHNCDFRFQNANLQFDNMDKLLDFLNSNHARYNVSIKWSSLSDYFSTIDSLYPASYWPVRGEDDFLPYDDNDESWWTGFYTSRPQLKGTIRKAEAHLRIVDNLFSFMTAVDPSNDALNGKMLHHSTKYENSGKNMEKSSHTSTFLNSSSAFNIIDQYHQNLAVTQHHDAVSGTERQLVADNYASLLTSSHSAADPIIESYINYIAQKPAIFSMDPVAPRSSFSDFFSEPSSINMDSNLDQTNQGNQNWYQDGENLQQSAQTGPSFSRLPKDLQSLGMNVPVTVLVYNSLRKSRYEVVKIPVWNTDIAVQDRKGKTLTASILSNLQIDDNYGAPYTLFVEAQHVPPAGFITLTLTRTSNPGPATTSQPNPTAVPTTISNGKDGLSVKIDWNGKISMITVEGSPIPFIQDLKAYHSYAGPGQASGAYIFRPDGTKAQPLGDVATATVRSTPLVNEIFQSFSPYANVTTRLYSNPQLYLDVTYRIGPLPGNRELISRFETAIATDRGEIATDNNGWAIMRRKHRKSGSYAHEGIDTPTPNYEPIASNYYPSVYSSYLHPPNGGVHFAVVSDRSHGVASVDKGTLEVMLHRRLLQDDQRGLDEALNDTSIVTMNQRFVFASDIYSGTTMRYHYALETNYPLTLFFSPIGGNTYNSQFTSAFNASHELPKGIQSFARVLNTESRKILVRYAYQYTYSDGYGPVSLDLSLAFGPLAGGKLCGVQETNLSGVITYGPPMPFRSSITIYPKEFRTFVYTPCNQ